MHTVIKVDVSKVVGELADDPDRQSGSVPGSSDGGSIRSVLPADQAILTNRLSASPIPNPKKTIESRASSDFYGN